MTIIKRAPVRIQIWCGDVRLDVRGWLDEFTMTNGTLDLTPVYPGPYEALRKDYSLTAHTDHRDEPWKFNRGKPEVVA